MEREDMKKIDDDSRHWKYEWHRVTKALERFAVGLLMTHEKMTEEQAWEIVGEVEIKARRGE